MTGTFRAFVLTILCVCPCHSDCSSWSFRPPPCHSGVSRNPVLLKLAPRPWRAGTKGRGKYLCHSGPRSGIQGLLYPCPLKGPAGEDGVITRINSLNKFLKIIDICTGRFYSFDAFHGGLFKLIIPCFHTAFLFNLLNSRTETRSKSVC